jgi:Mrp family chromosome partitioning ATPase
MLTKEQILNELDSIAVPNIGRSLVEMNLVRDIVIGDGNLEIKLASTGLIEETREWLIEAVEQKLKTLSGIKRVKTSYGEATPKELNQIKNIVAIMSGKGGVGKSLVSSMLAISLKRQGLAVGILDADVTGPSIPRMFGVTERPTYNENAMLPVTSRSGIEMMSLNLLLEREDDAVIWRGPIIAKIITQFWEEVLWGTLDYLIVDLPPGTADVPLTVLQQIPVTGIVIVTTPQDLTTMIVKKAVKMAQKMEKPILGVVENMSYLYVAEIKKKIELFGKSRGEEIAKMAGAPLLALIPVDTELAALIDKGELESFISDDLDQLGKSITELAALKH